MRGVSYIGLQKRKVNSQWGLRILKSLATTSAKAVWRGKLQNLPAAMRGVSYIGLQKRKVNSQQGLRMLKSLTTTTANAVWWGQLHNLPAPAAVASTAATAAAKLMPMVVYTEAYQVGERPSGYRRQDEGETNATLGASQMAMRTEWNIGWKGFEPWWMPDRRAGWVLQRSGFARVRRAVQRWCPWEAEKTRVPWKEWGVRHQEVVSS